MVKIVDARKVVINNQKGLSSHVEQHRFHRQDDGGDDGLPSLTLLVFLTLLIFIIYICTRESVYFNHILTLLSMYMFLFFIIVIQVLLSG